VPGNVISVFVKESEFCCVSMLSYINGLERSCENELVGSLVMKRKREKWLLSRSKCP
jgi:hypothetical protein